MVDGIELSSLSPTDISIGIGAGRINGLIVIVDSAEAVIVTGNGTRYCHLHIVRANIVDPSSVEIVFLDAKSDDKDYLFLGSAVVNGDGTGFDVDMLDVPRDMGIRNDFFGDGREGNVVISADTTIDEDKQYENLTINAGVTVTLQNQPYIRVLRRMTILGTIRYINAVNGGDGGQGGEGYGTFNGNNPNGDSNGKNGVNGVVGNNENIASIGSNGAVATIIADPFNDTTLGNVGNGGSRISNVNVIPRTFEVFGKIVLMSSGSGGGGGAGTNSTNFDTFYDGGVGGNNITPNGANGDGIYSIESGGGGGAGGSSGGVIKILANSITYGGLAILDVSGGNGGDGGDGHSSGGAVNHNALSGKGGVGSGGDGGIVAVFSKSDKGFDTSKFLIGKGLKGVVVNGYDDGNATDGSDGQVWRGFV